MKISHEDIQRTGTFKGRDEDEVHLTSGPDTIEMSFGFTRYVTMTFGLVEWSCLMDSIEAMATRPFGSSKPKPTTICFVDGDCVFTVRYTNWCTPYEQGLQFEVEYTNKWSESVALEASVLKDIVRWSRKNVGNSNG